MDYTKHVNPRSKKKAAPQSEPIPGKAMVQNSAGGYSFTVSDWDRLDRFLVLGTEGGTYYSGERKLTKENAKTVENLLKEDGVRVVNRVVELSDAGRTPKNDPALFVLAMATAADDENTRAAALAALPKVARIGTHLFHFAQFVEGFRGWGRGLRKAIASWYNDQSLNDLVYQVVKYKQRDGWSHRDLLRLSHPKATTEERSLLYKWVTNKESVADKFTGLTPHHPFVRIEAAEKLATLTDPQEAVKLITELRMPREVVNTSLLNEVKVWEALLKDMPITALVRNLGKMTSIGLLKPLSEATKLVVSKLTDDGLLKKGRVHPLALLVALKTYEQGRGEKGSLTWTPVPAIVDALDEAFYKAFQVVVPTGKRTLLGLDVSASMGWGTIAGMAGITPSIAAAAMSMVTARTEATHHIMGFADGLRNLGITPRQRLDEVLKRTNGLTFGGTDCSLPMVWALKNEVEVDSFVVYTDNETWAGNIHPKQALDQYRQKTGIPAKLAVVAFTGTEFTIADPSDAGMMDFVGFDTAAPSIMSDFFRDRE